jgi:hypothetical protein
MPHIVVIFAVSFIYGKVDERKKCEDVSRRERQNVHSKRLRKENKNLVML